MCVFVESYSRGRAELLLIHLLTKPNSDGDLETNSVNISDTIRRQIPLIDRSGSLLEGTSTSNIVASPAVQSVCGGNSLSVTNQSISTNTNAAGQPSENSIPSIIAEVSQISLDVNVIDLNIMCTANFSQITESHPNRAILLR